MLKITPIVWFCIVSTHSFILNLSANALYDFHSGIVEHSKRNSISTRTHVLFAAPRSRIDNGDKHIKAIGRILVYWEQNELKNGQEKKAHSFKRLRLESYLQFSGRLKSSADILENETRQS